MQEVAKTMSKEKGEFRTFLNAKEGEKPTNIGLNDAMMNKE